MRINTRLSDCVADGFRGGPEYSTEITPMDNGGDQRNAQWIWPRHRYSAEFLNLQEDARDEIIAAFHVCVGREHSFRFKDWNDYQTNGTTKVGTIAPAVGTMEPAQLYVTYAFGPATKLRKITAPVGSTIVITSDGDPVTVTIDELTGMATPDATWPAGTYAWSGEYDVWVNFDADYNAFTINNWRAHTADIELVENKGLG